MQGKQPSEDELARRRARRGPQSQGDHDEGHGEEEDLPKFTWSDTLAMIIAAYQVLLPMLLAMVGVMVAAYFLFRWFFS